MASFFIYTISISYLLIMLPMFICISDQAFSEDISEAIAMKRMMKTSHLHFYFHDIVSGKNPSAMKVIGTEIMSFGTTFIIDDALTEGQEPTSKIVGRAQGLYAVAAQNDLALLMVINYSFTDGKFNGSSISILGRNHVFDDIREMPIVGGTGLFRFARGYALAHTIWFDIKTGDATVEYNVFVQHF
ncbi:dirigent protein 22-like [Coffea eugenioides]|uniref:Dirigent protein n=1 Tax=Coffea arabica TaxID=13443 RepID=A0A6P6TYT4_COFAR|nr:dirigent protein 22-like [Coffea arabica]XP_027083518.1 dirigent protein 22-like [Coffea arabica]XP_027163097.1 dirigent protein 22-like [Coffea eugenioides]